MAKKNILLLIFVVILGVIPIIFNSANLELLKGTRIYLYTTRPPFLRKMAHAKKLKRDTIMIFY